MVTGWLLFFRGRFPILGIPVVTIAGFVMGGALGAVVAPIVSLASRLGGRQTTATDKQFPPEDKDAVAPSQGNKGT
jgi:hypothetical protein